MWRGIEQLQPLLQVTLEQSTREVIARFVLGGRSTFWTRRGVFHGQFPLKPSVRALLAELILTNFKLSKGFEEPLCILMIYGGGNFAGHFRVVEIRFEECERTTRPSQDLGCSFGAPIATSLE